MQISTYIHGFIKEIEVSSAILFGAFMQFIFGNTKTIKVGFIILVSSIFVAIYIILPAIELLDIDNRKIEASMYALSSLISVEFIAIIIVILPNVISDRIEKFFNVKVKNNVTKNKE